MHLRAVILAVTLAGTAGCSCYSQGEKGAAISLVRGLPSRRLEQLFTDASNLAPLGPNESRRLYDKRSGIPRSFEDLRPIEVLVLPDRVRVLMFACYDDKVTVSVHGSARSGTITLEPGEAQNPVVLWSRR